MATPDEPDPDEMLTVKEVAALLKVNIKTVYAEIAAGHIGYLKVGRLFRIPRTVISSKVQQVRVCR
jgi:excisionase family DNA binding protein